MNDVLKFGKKLFTFSVVAMTLAWSLGVSALVPAVAHAEGECPVLVAGDLVRLTGNSAVFMLNTSFKRLYFPNSEVFHTWYSNFDGVNVLTQTCFNAYTAADSAPYGVGFRPGSVMVKEEVNNTVYAVTPMGVKVALPSEAVATSLYGANWATKVRDINSAWWTTVYPTVGTALTSAVPTEGMLVKKAGSDATYFVKTGKLSLVSGTLGAATASVQTVSDTVFNTLEEVATGSVTSATILDTLANLGQGSSVPVTGGNLNVSLSASTPTSTNLPNGSAFNEVLKLNFSAGSTGATINGLTLKKGGYFANTGISGVDVVDANGMRHGNVASSINSDNEVVLLFGSNPVTVAANSSATLTVRVNLAAGSTASTLQMGLGVVNTTASVTGLLPVWGNSFNVVDGAQSIATATIDVQPIGGAANTNLNADPDNFQEVTKFRISEGASKEDLKLYGLSLYNYGNAAATDYKDVQLVAVDGTVVATAQPSGQDVVFDLSSAPYVIAKGQSKDFTVRMKIVSGTTRTIQLVVYNDYDLRVKGASTGAFVLPTAATNSIDTTFPIGDATNYNLVTIASGTLSFNKDVTSPSASLTPGASNVVLAKYYAKPTGENMELRKVNFGITQTNSALTGNVYVKVNDATVWSGAASDFAVIGTTYSKTLSTYPTLVAGQNSYITVEGSVPSTATSGVSYVVQDFDITEVKRLISNSIITDSTIAVNPTDGNTLQVNAVALSGKTLSTPVAQNIVAGTNDFTFANIQLDAQSSGEDVRVASLIISNAGTGTTTNISNLELFDGVNVLPTSNSTATGAASTTFTFSTPLVVTKGTIKTLTLKADVTAGTSLTHKFVLYSVSATGKTTGTTASVSVSGSGQAMTLVGAGAVTLTLQSGTSASPSQVQTVNVATTDGTYFAFKVNAQNEAIKLRTLKLTAAGTALSSNDIVNLRLYKDSSATPFATASEMTCSSNTCTYTWTATDNLLSDVVVPGTPITIYAKADIGAAGIANLGHDFAFSIAATSTDFVGVGDATQSAFVVTGAPTVSVKTHIVPWSVEVVGFSPTSVSTVGLGSGINVGEFQVVNHGTGQIILVTSTFTNSGSATDTMDWILQGSVDGGSSNDASVSLGAAATSTQSTWGTLGSTASINGGSYRYLTIKTDAAGVNNDTHHWSVNALGSLLYSVTEAQLGYDENHDGDQSDTIENLYVSGTPALAVVTAKT